MPQPRVNRMVGALFDWARRTSSSFAELRESGWRSEPDSSIDDSLVYRLREWPELPCAMRTAPVLRVLSLMSNRPVNRQWLANHSQLSSRTLDSLLQRLVAQEAVEVIDTSGWTSRVPSR